MEGLGQARVAPHGRQRGGRHRPPPHGPSSSMHAMVGHRHLLLRTSCAAAIGKSFARAEVRWSQSVTAIAPRLPRCGFPDAINKKHTGAAHEARCRRAQHRKQAQQHPFLRTCCFYPLLELTRHIGEHFSFIEPSRAALSRRACPSHFKPLL